MVSNYYSNQITIMTLIFKSCCLTLILGMLISCDSQMEDSVSPDQESFDKFSLIPSSMQFRGEINDRYDFVVNGETIDVDVTSSDNHSDYEIILGEGESINIGNKVVFEDGTLVQYYDYTNIIRYEDGLTIEDRPNDRKILFIIEGDSVAEYIYDSTTIDGSHIRSERSFYYGNEKSDFNFNLALYGEFRTDPLVFLFTENLPDSAKEEIQIDGRLQPIIRNHYFYDRDSNGRIVKFTITENEEEIINCEISY